MPTIKLTQRPNFITSYHALDALWACEILAHSFYPTPGAADARSKWVEKIQRQFSRDWTSRLCVLPNAGEFYAQWFARHHLAQTPDDIRDLKRNEDRDLQFAAQVLIDCTLGGYSKRKAVGDLAKKLHSQDEANSVPAAEVKIKRAWRKYDRGCHYVAAHTLLREADFGSGAQRRDFAIYATIALAEKLRAIAETRVPLRGTVPILPAGKSWKVPEWFPRPEVEVVDWRDGSGTIKFEMTIFEVSAAEPA
jgi:hypothetical protein